MILRFSKSPDWAAKYFERRLKPFCTDWFQSMQENIPPPWPSWQGESGVRSFDLDGVGSIPAIPPTQFTCFIDEFNKLV
jgi:hypothetical protein